MAEQGPMIEGLPVVKGMVCGSLLAGAFAVQHGIAVQVVLFIMAALVFMDSIFIFGRETHILSFLTAMVIGIVLCVVMVLVGMTNPAMVVTFVVMAIIYLYEFMTRREGKQRHKHASEKEHEAHPAGGHEKEASPATQPGEPEHPPGTT